MNVAFRSKCTCDAAWRGELSRPQRVFHTPPLKAQGSLEAAAFVYSALPPTKVYPGSTGVLGYANISLH